MNKEAPSAEQETCPKCGAPIQRDYVDIGVGNMPIPTGCERCGWHEDADAPDFSGRCQETWRGIQCSREPEHKGEHEFEEDFL